MKPLYCKTCKQVLGPEFDYLKSLSISSTIKDNIECDKCLNLRRCLARTASKSKLPTFSEAVAASKKSSNKSYNTHRKVIGVKVR